MLYFALVFEINSYQICRFFVKGHESKFWVVLSNADEYFDYSYNLSFLF
jgi:hypothetical protein